MRSMCAAPAGRRNGNAAPRVPAGCFLRPPQGGLRPVGFGRRGASRKAPDELVQVQRNGTCRRAATTSATQHAPGEGSPTASVADGRRAIRNSSAACSTPHCRARRREHARGAPVTRTETHALRVAVPTTPQDGPSDDAQRTQAGASTAPASNLPGHLTALRPSPDASTRHHFGSRRRGEHTEYGRAYMPGHEPLAAANRARIRREIRRAERSWAGDPADSHPQRAGTWHEQRGSSARHLPMTHGRDRGAAEAANSARQGGECNLPAHHQRSGGVGSTHAQPCIRSRRVDGRQACRYEIGLEAGVAPGPLHQKPAALLPALESAHSLLTAIGGRLCSMGENGQYPLLTPASLHNGCEQTMPVSGSLFKVRPTLACREKASLHSRTPRSISRCSRCTRSATLRRAHASIDSSMGRIVFFLPRAEMATDGNA